MRLRDNQRERVYRAEEVIWKRAENYKTVQEVETYVKSVLDNPWFQATYPWVKSIKIYDGRRRRRAVGGKRHGQPYMKLPKWTRNKPIILHELSHGLAPDTVAWHGPEFCLIYAELVAHFIDSDTYQKLMQSFRDNRVKVQGE